jgi:hypothetical protein
MQCLPRQTDDLLIARQVHPQIAWGRVTTTCNVHEKANCTQNLCCLWALRFPLADEGEAPRRDCRVKEGQKLRLLVLIRRHGTSQHHAGVSAHILEGGAGAGGDHGTREIYMTPEVT